jgi:hypothetical protein
LNVRLRVLKKAGATEGDDEWRAALQQHPKVRLDAREKQQGKGMEWQDWERSWRR